LTKDTVIKAFGDAPVDIAQQAKSSASGRLSTGRGIPIFPLNFVQIQ
jgi:hypothetical protein